MMGRAFLSVKNELFLLLLLNELNRLISFSNVG